MDATARVIDLSGFTDEEADEVAHWQRIEREALNLCHPLSKMIGHKEITFALGVSGGQLSKELSGHDEKRLSMAVALYILRHSQNDKLARLLICDGAGYRLPEPQKRKVTAEEEVKALREACKAAGLAGQAILEDATRRAKAGVR